MASPNPSRIGKITDLAKYGADLLGEIRSSHALEVHFENQNAALFGVGEILRRLTEFDELRMEVHRSNQLLNVVTAEMNAFNNAAESLERRVSAIEESVADTQDRLERIEAAITKLAAAAK